MAFKESNSQVNREHAERLQRKLFEAAERALDLALADEKVPANLRLTFKLVPKLRPKRLRLSVQTAGLMT